MSKLAILLLLAPVIFSGTNSASPKDAMPVLTTAALPDEGPEPEASVDLVTVMNTCNETFRTEMSYIEALNQSGSFPDESDRNPKCYVRCVLMATSIVSEDGVFDPSRVAPVFGMVRGGKPMSNVEETATTCAEKRKETCKCESAYQYMKCLVEMEIKEQEKS